MKFYPGQPVICINGKFSWARRTYAGYGCTWPEKGRRYVVRGYACGGLHPAVLLQEISNPLVPYNDKKMREAGFAEDRFRPITDISDLSALLKRRSMPRRRETPNWDRKRQPTPEPAVVEGNSTVHYDWDDLA